MVVEIHVAMCATIHRGAIIVQIYVKEVVRVVVMLLANLHPLEVIL